MTIAETSVLAVSALGIPKPAGFDGSFASFGALQPNDRIRVTNWVSAYVRDHPEKFTPAQVNVADGPDGTGWVAEEMTDESTLDTVDEFFREMGNEGISLVGDPLVSIGKASSVILSLVPLILVGFLVWQVYKSRK